MILGIENELIRFAGRRRWQVELCNETRRSSFKQAEILKVKNQVMCIGRIGRAVRLVSRFRTVCCGETHQMMYEIVDLSILQHF